jgi:alpha-mannosidase
MTRAGNTEEVIIAASTHWDREWYRTFSEFRIRLCELVNRLLPLLEGGTIDRYTFDGQSVVLEDYLEAYPENEGRIRKLVQEGRLLFGPLYNLPDEFLSGGETLIRNFLAGDEVCSRIGGKCRAGYVPDNFGHVSQLPQILRGAGIDTAFFFRGTDLKTLGHKEFWWISPDGSRVAGEYMPLGYWSLKSWGRLGKSAAGHFLEAYHALQEISALGCVLLINGSDHLFQDPDFPALLEEARKALPGVPVRNGGLRDYAELLVRRAEASPELLTEIRGELRDFRAGPDPTAVASTRSRLKRRLFKAKAELLRYAEPLAAGLMMMGHEYPAGVFGCAWKNVLKALGHDGVSGCSSDRVIRDIESYLRHAHEAAAFIASSAMGKFLPAGKEPVLLVFNPLRYVYTGVISAEVCIEDEQVQDFVLVDETGKAGAQVEWEYVSCRRDVVTREFDYNSKERVYRRCFKIRFWVENLKPLSVNAYRILPSKTREFRRKEFAVRLTPSCSWIENEYCRINVQGDTSLRLTVKKTGRVYSGLNLLMSRGEAGDTYQHVSPLADEHTFPVLSGVSVAANSDLASELRIRGELRPPAGAAGDFLERKRKRSLCVFQTTVRLCRGSPLVEIRTEFDNQAEDHVLFAAFPVPSKEAGDFSWIAFDEVSHDAALFDFRPELKSTQSVLCAFEGYAGLAFPGGSLAVTSRGLSEYHVKTCEDGQTLYLTLLRSTGWMFHGLPHNWQDGQASTTPVIKTPAAQEKGRNVFEYALLPDTDNLLFHAEAYRFPQRCAVVNGLPEGKNNLHELMPDLSETDERIGLSALKKWRFGNGLVLRLFNNSGETVSFSLGAGRGTVKVSLADLLENPLEELPLAGGKVSLSAAPRRIITLILHRA